MERRCRWGKFCLHHIEEVLKQYKKIFKPCERCENPKLKKFKPLSLQLDLDMVNKRLGRCICGRRHLDLVMSHILKIMVEEELLDHQATLRDVGAPLLSIAYPKTTSPFLLPNSIILLSSMVNFRCAQRICHEVPEVKGVLKGDSNIIVGLKDAKSPPHQYELLAGCDLRCDIHPTPYGEICIYKFQGEIHIELPKPYNSKIMGLKDALERHSHPKVLDATCGPGTLGITALKAGASQVTFNDWWYPAALITAFNLNANGFTVETFPRKSGLIASAPNIKVLCMDINQIKKNIDQRFEIGIIDNFPGVNSTDLARNLQEICGEILILQ